MSGQQWRKALWHLRHGGISGLKQYTRQSGSERNAEKSSEREESSEYFTPTLSVIVPAFNASDFIGRCLQSILQQEDVSIEVVVVDDGSKDDTATIAADLARGDDRITVLTGPNSGPADARNRGIEAAHGRYLAFVDADDEVVPGAYAVMVDSLERTGSDLATGSYLRVGSAGRSRPKVTARVHSRQRLAVRLDDMPELLEEPVLWNKVYRREFWRRHVGKMTSFANYEDQDPVYRALVGAAAIDVLTIDVYSWRLADGRKTRSRHKAKLTDLYAKLEVINALGEVLEHEPENVLERAYAIWVGTDLAMHAEYLSTASNRYRKNLCSAVYDLRKSMPRNAWKLIPAQERLFMWVVASGRLDDIEEILGTRAEETKMVPLESVGNEWMVAPTYVHRLRTKIPKRLLKAQEVDFVPQLVVRNARWIDQRTLELQGCGYVPGVDPRDVEVRMRGIMDGGVVFDTDVEYVDDNRVDLEVGDPWRSYGSAGFRVRMKLQDIGDLSPRGIELFGCFQIARAKFQVPAKSSTVVGMIAPSPIVASRRVTLVANRHDELSIQSVKMPASPVVAKHVTCSGREVTVTLNGHIDVSSINLKSAGITLPMAAQGRSSFTAELPVLPNRYQSGGERSWKAFANSANGTDSPVYHETVDYLLPDTSCVRLLPNISGEVCVTQRFRRVSVTGATNDRDRLLITGRIDPPAKLSVVLKSSEQTIAPVETSIHADGSYTAVYDLTTVGSEGSKIAALSGGYFVRHGSSPNSADGWAFASGKLAIRPVDCLTEWNTLRLEGRATGTVAMTASPPWTTQERTRYGQFQLRERDWGRVTNGIVFEAFNGKTANDNPRGLFEAISTEYEGTPLYWSVRDRRVEVPSPAIPIVEGTAAWHRAIATSRVWINNNNFPYYLRKQPGQFYLQTWHGTPIKRLLWDIPVRNVPLTYRRLMRTEVRQWDLLLAQSEEAAENLKTGLGYQGPVHVAEYPRNFRLLEALMNPQPIRERLGIGSDELVVLYVPTWRDQHRNGRAMNWTDYLNPEALARETGTRVLVRSHHMTRTNAIDSAGVIDVSSEPFIEDLMAITDILITDYSSAAIDFELTGRQAIHFLPDLSEYKCVRGLYNNASSRLISAATTQRELHELIAMRICEQPSDATREFELPKRLDEYTQRILKSLITREQM